jgi:hypothetical protein
MRKSGNRFSSPIPLSTLAIDQFHDFGGNQSKIIVIDEIPRRRGRIGQTLPAAAQARSFFPPVNQ